ncbi:MAG TPA: GntR family transcriptional regulator [Streptosporangiaceae bacterium]|nr:GntR family transcriptional regulator [Streptosporangiaceae bacterium]
MTSSGGIGPSAVTISGGFGGPAVTGSGGIGAPVRGERTADVVARRLGQAILSGEIAPGSRLREETLAKQFSVSRTPVREALIMLSASGLVEVEPNRGATVLRLTADDVAEVYRLRALLESESAALAARRSTPGMADLLAKICDRMADLRGARASEQLAADTSFHYTIAEAAGSPRLHSLIRQVSAIPEAYRSSIAYTSDDMAEAERQHRAIATVIGYRRHAQARTMMRSHVMWAGRLAVQRLEHHLGTGDSS